MSAAFMTAVKIEAQELIEMVSGELGGGCPDTRPESR